MPRHYTPVQWLALFLIVAVVINIIVFAFRLISGMVFWIVIAIAALFAYKVIPSLNKK